MTQDLFDITIIGGGPAGLFAAYYAGLRHMKTKIIDSLDELGGQLMTLYPEKYVFDVPGFPKVLARDLANNLIEQAMQYHPTVCLGETLQTLVPSADNTAYALTTDKGVHHTRTLLIASGAGAFSAKKLPLPTAAALENKGVYYAVKSKATFAGKRVLVIGGGDSAVDWSTNLSDVAAHITLIHRRDQFRAHEHNVKRLRQTPVQVMTFYELKDLITHDGQLAAAVIENNQTGEKKTIEVQAVLAQLGFVSSPGPIRNWGLKFERGACVVDSRMQTSLPRVFAAGDGAWFEGKLKLIATGFGEAAMAVNFAKTMTDPAAKLFPGHSSEMVSQPQSVIKM